MEVFITPEMPFKPKRIIDYDTHLGDIFHENQNISFKRPGFVADPPGFTGFDPFKDLEESGYTRPLIVDDVEAQNKLIDAGQVRIWQRANIFTTQAIMDAAGIDYMAPCPSCPTPLSRRLWPLPSWTPALSPSPAPTSTSPRMR